MIADAVTLQGDDNLPTIPFNNWTHRKTFWPLLLVTLGGCLFGASIVFAAGLPYKWVFVLSAAACFPIFAVALGSVKRALEALLIFSFSMVMDVHLGFSDQYQDVRYGIPITMTGVILVVLYILWAWRLCHHTDRVRLFPVVSVPFALLVVWSGLSFLWAPKPDYALYTLWGMVEVLFLYFYAANLVKSRDDLSFIVTCITVTVAISAIVAICQYATGSSFGLEFLGGREAQELLELQMPGISRAAGLLISANSLAWFLKLWLPLLLLWGIAGPHRISRSLCLVSFLLGLLALLVSFSRAGWLAFTFSLVLIAMWLMKRSFRKYLRGALPRFLVLGTIVVVLSIPFVPRVVERLSRDDYGAAYSRIPLAKVALNMIWHNPVIGVGMGNYKYVMGKYDNTPERITRITAQKIPLAVHNIYLMLAAELGIGALAIFVFISIAIFWQGLRTLGLRDKTVVLFVVAILAGLAAFYLQGMSDPGIIGSCKFRPFWFMAGAVLACSEGREEKLT